MGNGIKNPPIAPTSELRAAYNDVKSFYTQKSVDFFANYDVNNNAQIQSDVLSNFTSTVLSSDGSFFTSDLFGSKKVTEIDALKPLTFEKGLTGDVTCYGAGPISSGKSSDLYQKLSVKLSTVSTPSVNTVSTPPAGSAPTAEVSNSPDSKAQAKAEEAKEEFYTVKEGDWLSKIAQAQLGDINRWHEIYDLNKDVIDDPNLIYPGMKLKLPKRQDVTSESSPATAAAPSVAPSPKPEPAPTPTPVPVPVQQAVASFSYNKINSDPKLPDALNSPHVSLYRYGNPYISVGTAASDYCNIFFNGIDNINLSLCVPYLRINVIDRFSKRGKKYPSMSLISFLKSSNQRDENDKIFYNAQPVLFDAKKRGLTGVSQKLRNANVIGMEAFQAPNTLLPDPTVILDNPRRLDTSVPLMTLESLTVAIESNGIAALSKKTADLSIVLHDRSRLKDISTLVSMGSYSSLYFEIEWGWTHPHAAAQFNNPIAQYLNALRIKEIFCPISYNMTLQNGGGMQISLRLMAGAVVDSINCSVLTGNFVTRSLALDYFNRFIKATIDSDPALSRDGQIETRPVTTLLTSQDRKGQLIKRDFIDKILTYTRQDDINTPEKSEKIINELETIVNDAPKQFSNKDGIIALEQGLKSINVTGFGDQIFEKMKSKFSNLSVQDYTSVGAYLTQIIAAPLAASGLYDEVQVHAFTFNDNAGAMAGLPISDACINISDFMGKEGEAGSLYENDAVARAITNLCTKLSNPMLQTYMVEQRVEPGKKNTTTEAATETVEKRTDKNARSNASDQTADLPADFTTPNIKHLIRSVPAKVFSENATSLADASVDNTRVIAQILIYDANSTPDPGVLVKAYEYTMRGNSVGELTSDRAKEIAKTAYPSITYGSLNSVIENVSVSTDTNGPIQTQAALDAFKGLNADNLKADKVANITELTVFPVSISVTMFGLPIIERGQEIYLDLGTGTTLDNVYYVMAVRHDLRNMKFSTNLTLSPKNQGTVRGIGRIIENYKEILNKKQGQKNSADGDKKETSAPVSKT